MNRRGFLSLIGLSFVPVMAKAVAPANASTSNLDDLSQSLSGVTIDRATHATLHVASSNIIQCSDGRLRLTNMVLR